MTSHLSGEGLVHHMNLMKRSIIADHDKKIESMNKKLTFSAQGD
jgi:hypothetical protein